MPLDKFVLILLIVIAAAGLTIWVATLVVAAGVMPAGWLVLIPVLLGVYVLWRVIADRLASRDDDRYDRIEK